eukprot:Nk52_evm84s158 gene=Nk52_evmTU84s158
MTAPNTSSPGVSRLISTSAPSSSSSSRPSLTDTKHIAPPQTGGGTGQAGGVVVFPISHGDYRKFLIQDIKQSISKLLEASLEGEISYDCSALDVFVDRVHNFFFHGLRSDVHVVRNGGFPEGFNVLKYLQLVTVANRDGIVKDILTKVTTCFGQRTHSQQNKVFFKIVVASGLLYRVLYECGQTVEINEQFYENYSVMNNDEIDSLADLCSGLAALVFEDPPAPENEDCMALRFGNSFARKSLEDLLGGDGSSSGEIQGTGQGEEAGCGEEASVGYQEEEGGEAQPRVSSKYAVYRDVSGEKGPGVGDEGAGKVRKSRKGSKGTGSTVSPTPNSTNSVVGDPITRFLSSIYQDGTRAGALSTKDKEKNKDENAGKGDGRDGERGERQRDRGTRGKTGDAGEELHKCGTDATNDEHDGYNYDYYKTAPRICFSQLHVGLVDQTSPPEYDRSGTKGSQLHHKVLPGHLSLVDPGYKAPCILCWMPLGISDISVEGSGQNASHWGSSMGGVGQSTEMDSTEGGDDKSESLEEKKKEVINMHVRRLILDGSLHSTIHDDVVEKKGFAVSVAELHSLEYRIAKSKEWGELAIVLSGGFLLDLSFESGGIQNFLQCLGEFCSLVPIFVTGGNAKDGASGTPAFYRESSSNSNGLSQTESSHSSSSTTETNTKTNENSDGGLLNLLSKFTGDALSLLGSKQEQNPQPEAHDFSDIGLDTVLQYRVKPKRKSIPSASCSRSAHCSPYDGQKGEELSELRRRTVELMKPFKSEEILGAGEKNMPGDEEKSTTGVHRKSDTDHINLVNLENSSGEARVIDKICQSLLANSDDNIPSGIARDVINSCRLAILGQAGQNESGQAKQEAIGMSDTPITKSGEVEKTSSQGSSSAGQSELQSGTVGNMQIPKSKLGEEGSGVSLKACPPLKVRSTLPMMKSHKRLRSYNEFVYKPLGRDMWQSFMDEKSGRFLHEDAVRKTIYLRGIHSNIRREVWKYLLSYYDFDSTIDDRKKLCDKYKKSYSKMKMEWEGILKKLKESGGLEESCDHWHPDQPFEEKVKNLMASIQKDIVRTDRRLTFYEGSDNKNVEALGNILLTYTTVYDAEHGYVQGMSDLLSPILAIMQDESAAFWCFTGFMKFMKENFSACKKNLEAQMMLLRALIALLDPEFADFMNIPAVAIDEFVDVVNAEIIGNEEERLRIIAAADLHKVFFSYRWFLLNFKREFSLVDCMRIWETIWSGYYTNWFQAFIGFSIVRTHRDHILSHNICNDDMLEYFASIALEMDGIDILCHAKAYLSAILEDNTVSNTLKIAITSGTSYGVALVESLADNNFSII